MSDGEANSCITLNFAPTPSQQCRIRVAKAETLGWQFPLSPRGPCAHLPPCGQRALCHFRGWMPEMEIRPGRPRRPLPAWREPRLPRLFRRIFLWTRICHPPASKGRESSSSCTDAVRWCCISDREEGSGVLHDEVPVEDSDRRASLPRSVFGTGTLRFRLGTAVQAVAV